MPLLALCARPVQCVVPAGWPYLLPLCIRHVVLPLLKEGSTDFFHSNDQPMMVLLAIQQSRS